MNRVDRKDLVILEALLEDSRRSNRELARITGLAESTTLERVRRLEHDGVIRGSHIDVELAPFGIHLQAMVMVGTQRHTRHVVEAFRDDMLRLSEVVAVYLVSGEHDFMIHVAVRDAEHLRELELDKITARPEVTSVETHLIFEHERRYGLPVDSTPHPGL